jgi:hypothetical protein
MEDVAVARSYYSTIFDRSADEIWSHIRDFGDYAWAGVLAKLISRRENRETP